MTTQVSVNPFAERHRLRVDITAARIASDTARGQLAQCQAERKRAEADAFSAEMDLAVGTKGAAKRRDAALEKERGAEHAAAQYERALEAASRIIKIREGQLELLHDDDEAFPAFVQEAESATAASIRDMEELRTAITKASQSWAKASGFWRPLNGALRRRLEELNEREGVYHDVPSQAVIPPFPIDLASDLLTLTPRPPGIGRLRRAEQAGPAT